MNFIGVDIGGTVTKAGIYNELGQEIHVASQYAQVLSEQPGFTERNMHELWDTVCSVIKKALYESQVPPLSIGGIGFSSHGKGLCNGSIVMSAWEVRTNSWTFRS